ncbi:protein of unknown function [Tenacibaculum litopenaei]
MNRIEMSKHVKTKDHSCLNCGHKPLTHISIGWTNSIIKKVCSECSQWHILSFWPEETINKKHELK